MSNTIHLKIGKKRVNADGKGKNLSDRGAPDTPGANIGPGEGKDGHTEPEEKIIRIPPRSAAKLFDESTANLPPAAALTLTEHAMAGIVGGKTGLMACFRGLLSEAEAGNAMSFRIYVQMYDARCAGLRRQMDQYLRLLSRESGDKPRSVPAGETGSNGENLIKRISGKFRERTGRSAPDKTGGNGAGEQRASVNAAPAGAPVPTGQLPLYKLLLEVGESLKDFADPEDITSESMETWRVRFQPRLNELTAGYGDNTNR